MTYYDMIQHGKIMMPVSDETLPNQLFRSIDPIKDAAADSWKRVITQPNFRDLSIEVTLTERLIISIRKNIVSRVIEKFRAGGLGGLISAIKNKF